MGLFVTSQSQRSTMTYKHLTREERYQIHSLKRQGVSLGCIAAELQRNRSTISRELQRNAGASGYKPAQAHDRALARQRDRHNAQHLKPAQWAHVEALLRLSLSLSRSVAGYGWRKPCASAQSPSTSAPTATRLRAAIW